jgi:hypothetical protein
MEREYDDTLWQQSEHFPLYWEMKQWISDYTPEPVNRNYIQNSRIKTVKS